MGIERRGMIIRKEFSDLLDLYLRDPDKIRLPARIEVAALDSLYFKGHSSAAVAPEKMRFLCVSQQLS